MKRQIEVEILTSGEDVRNLKEGTVVIDHEGLAWQYVHGEWLVTGIPIGSVFYDKAGPLDSGYALLVSDGYMTRE